jgi:LPS-assembly lipoprotein
MHAAFRYLVLAAAVALGACGFHLRGDVALPSNLQRVYVTSNDVEGPVLRYVEDTLKRSGATIEAAPGEGIADVKMSGVSVSTVVRSVSSAARVNEFAMVYHLELEITDGAGKVVLAKQPIEQVRTFTFDQTQALGTGTEQDTIRREMDRDMAQAVMRKIDTIERKYAQ